MFTIKSLDLLDAVESRVTQALARDNMADAIETVAAVVLAVLAVGAVGAAHLTPVRQEELHQD